MASPSGKRPGLKKILKSNRDILSEWSISQKNGPELSHFEGVTVPLKCVNTDWVYYPIPIGLPGTASRFRLVSNGSQAHIGTDDTLPKEGVNNYNIWHGVRRKVFFYIGKNSELFGKDPKHLKEPELEQGFLPVYTVKYGDCILECFAFSIPGVNVEQFMAVKLATTKKKGKFIFKFNNNTLEIKNGVLFDKGSMAASIKGARRTGNNTFEVSGKYAVMVCPILPIDVNYKNFLRSVETRFKDHIAHKEEQELLNKWSEDLSDISTYEGLKARTISFWKGVLSRSTRISIPEEKVDEALKTVLLNVHSRFEKDQINYSLGNSYARPYSFESTAPAIALGYFGYKDECRRAIEQMFFYCQTGLAADSCGRNLMAASEYYRLYRDVEFIRSNKKILESQAEKILEIRSAGKNGLLPANDFCGDIGTKVINIKDNAVIWKGLRDLGQVFKELGISGSNKYLTEAEKLRKAVLRTVTEHIIKRKGYKFLPVGVIPKGDESKKFEHGKGDPTTSWKSGLNNLGPYDSIFKDTMGGYYNLLIGMLLATEIFTGTDIEKDTVDYLFSHGAFIAGMARFKCYKDYTKHEYLHGVDLDDPYTCAMIEHLAKRGYADRVSAALYGKLAIGYTKNTLMSGETSYFKTGKGRPGRDMLLPPNTTGDAYFLNTLRQGLVTEIYNVKTGEYDELRIIPAIPRGWLAWNGTLKFNDLPTYFGPVSLEIESLRAWTNVKLVLPARNKYSKVYLYMRKPKDWKFTLPAGFVYDAENERIDISYAPRGKEIKTMIFRDL